MDKFKRSIKKSSLRETLFLSGEVCKWLKESPGKSVDNIIKLKDKGILGGILSEKSGTYRRKIVKLAEFSLYEYGYDIDFEEDVCLKSFKYRDLGSVEDEMSFNIGGKLGDRSSRTLLAQATYIRVMKIEKILKEISNVKNIKGSLVYKGDIGNIFLSKLIKQVVREIIKGNFDVEGCKKAVKIMMKDGVYVGCEQEEILKGVWNSPKKVALYNEGPSLGDIDRAVKYFRGEDNIEEDTIEGGVIEESNVEEGVAEDRVFLGSGKCEIHLKNGDKDFIISKFKDIEKVTLEDNVGYAVDIKINKI